VSGGADCRCDTMDPTTDSVTCASADCTGDCSIGVGAATFYLDADYDGIDDDWETTYCDGGECAVADGVAACSRGGSWGPNTAIDATATTTHYECIEIFQMARLGEVVFAAAAVQDASLSGVTLNGASVN